MPEYTFTVHQVLVKSLQVRLTCRDDDQAFIRADTLISDLNTGTSVFAQQPWVTLTNEYRLVALDGEVE